MMSEKRYFRVEYDEEWYLFDSTTISEQLVKEQAEYGYGVFANSLSPSEVVDLLNEQLSIIHRDEISIQTMMSNMEKLEKENEQLKEENEQLSKELKELEKNFEDLVDWSTKISKRNVVLDEKIGRLQQEEKLYAQEILRLNTLLKQYQSFKDLGGDY